MNARSHFSLLFVFLFLLKAQIGITQTVSVLSTGTWYRMPVSHNGVYKITWSFLKKSGLNPDSIDPRKIRLFGNKGGMLPQLNSTPRPIDLSELAIFVQGESDGKFNKDDYVLFYGEGPDVAAFDFQNKDFNYQKNLYSDENFYFLCIGVDNGKRIATKENLQGSFPKVDTFDDFIVHETDEHNILKSGREWFGEKFDLTTAQSFDYSVPGIEPHSTLRVISSVMSQSYVGATFQISINDAPLMEQYLPPISSAQYAEKGLTRLDTGSILDDNIGASASGNIHLKYAYNKSASGYAIGYLDYFVLSTKRLLGLYGHQTIFRSAASLQQPASTFHIQHPDQSVTIWNITDASQPRLQSYADGADLEFSDTSNTLQEYVLFDGTIPEPGSAIHVENQNLHGLSTPNMIVVTNDKLLQQAQELADHREMVNNWSIEVVTVEQIYNEFSSGRQDVTAIRDFVKMLYDKSPATLKALLLFGKGSYDYKDRIQNNTDLVPIYESYSSLHPLTSYSSDDYYGFMESSEGGWSEDPPVSHTLDIAVGRIPVKTPEEAENVVQKIVSYDNIPLQLGKWRKQLVFVADDGDGNTHQSQADQLAEYVESGHPEFETRKIFLDAYSQPHSPAGQISPETHEAIINAFEQGALIINYTGHGSEQLWAQERILDGFTLQQIRNKQFPLMVTATCEFGRHDDPQFTSNGENLLLKKNGGAIGLVATSRLVQSSTNFPLNKAFYNALLNGPKTYIGDVFRQTKNASESGVSNRNFSLLCDPSLMLAVPQLEIDSFTVKTDTPSDTLKALSSVTLMGKIVNNSGEVQQGFSGTVNVTLYDKRNQLVTLGDENAPFHYEQWKNRLFNGKASVLNGSFTIHFIVPKNIVYSIGQGKISAYAADPLTGRDAAGSTQSFFVGSSESGAFSESTAPVIQLYIGDTTFINGGFAGSDTYLIAKLFDENGISISPYGIGNDLKATLDDSAVYVLDDYYESDLDDFRSGEVIFPLHQLTPGRHHIDVSAWDVFNNPARASVDFIVKDKNAFVIERFATYPNPFRDRTQLFFTHNRAGDNLTGKLVIYNMKGALVRTLQFEIDNAPYWVDLFKFDAVDDYGKNLPSGLYVARLFVRSVEGGISAEGVTKLIITN